ncbi:MAG: hypothetical protein MK085_07795 [Phycisphaerales bacterium]|nr:hypothetical protein [Phycisphaerales bacterium]
MPLYEYECRDTGEVLTLLRTMDQADDPIEDPEGRGRHFTRKHSLFGVNAGGSTEPAAPPPPMGGGCGCGRPGGGCGH